jgi:hypothetical protein
MFVSLFEKLSDRYLAYLVVAMLLFETLCERHLLSKIHMAFGHLHSEHETDQ